MAITRSPRQISSPQLAALARELLSASTLCAIATVSPDCRAHLNTAYFAWSDKLDLVWLSDPQAKHSCNLRERPTTAIGVYDSNQTWGSPDRGIQLFGQAHELGGPRARDAETAYSARFPDYRAAGFADYRLYGFQPDRVKLFDERSLGSGVFVTARVGQGELDWEYTEVYDGGS